MKFNTAQYNEATFNGDVGELRFARKTDLTVDIDAGATGKGFDIDKEVSIDADGK